jgi:NAD(P)-dependent dehydrogenase (short-subunit alcohol dehydrogenase family)
VSGPRVAAVAGAAGVLGTAVVELLLERGWLVAGFDVTRSHATRSAVLDLSDRERVEQEVKAAAKELGEIDCLIALSGVALPSPLAEITHSAWRTTLRLHLLSTANFAWAVLPSMLDRGSGNIVTVCSDSALGAPGAGAHHAAASGAVLGFTKALAIELAKTGVQVNAIAAQLPSSGDDESSPLGREVRPAEVAATAAYLACERHFFLGQVLSPNGGRAI